MPAIALAIAGLSALNPVHPSGQGVPVLGSFLHLTGGGLHFHLGDTLSGTLLAMAATRCRASSPSRRLYVVIGVVMVAAIFPR